ncbi:MAG: sulfatase [Planctomycetes bacterium]|nr:sulfatase [Planctomycetota bacterium]
MRALILLAIVAASAWLVLRPSSAPRPNVLLVTIDTLRPDAVGQGTPAMDGFLAGATRFPRARTVAPLTLPAHASMFTGLMPSAHGLHDNVTEPLPHDRGFPLLAEQFRARGYATAAFASSGVLAAGTGIAHGFDVYECPDGEGESLPGAERVEAAVRFLEGARGRPWFVWVHIFDPHAPYLSFEGDARRPATREGDPPGALYLGDVRRADAALETLLAAAGDAIVVLASDHGESFGEHDEHTHGPLCYGSTIDAVLAIRAPGFGKGAADEGLRSVADVAPTLRRLCGLPAVPCDGRDLGGPPHETLVAESLFTFRVHAWGQCFAATDGDFTLVESGPRLELFDRRSDPSEKSPLSLSLPAYERLDRALEEFRAKVTPQRDGELHASLPAYGQARRRSSGYVARRENALLADPRAHLGAWMAAQDVPWIIGMARERGQAAPLEAALRRLADFARAAPKSPLVPHHRASVCEAMAEVTGEPSWLEVAARAQLEAMEKGYTGREEVRRAIVFAEAAGDGVVLRSIEAILRAGGRPIDADTQRELTRASLAIAAKEGDRRFAVRAPGR